MKKQILLFKKTSQPRWLLSALMLVSFVVLNFSQAQAQCPPGAVCATYTVGDIASDFDFDTPADFPAACLGSVSVTIPAGDWVDSVSTSYDMTAANGAWMSEQRTWLYSPTTLVGEPASAAGAGLGGTFNYNRTGLSFANTAIGTISIELHVGRTWGGSGCDPSYNKVDNSTWQVIVYHSTQPSCLPATGVQNINTLATSAAFSWGAVSAAVGYEYEVRTSGAPGSGPTGLVTSGTTTNNSLTATGLTPNTSYDFYVRTDCGASSFSNWNSGVGFQTSCTVLTMPYLEDFDTWPLTCWDATGGSTTWQPYTATAGQYARADFWTNNGGTYWLTTNPIAVSVDAQIRFDWSHLYSASYPDDRLVVRLKSISATTWDTVINLNGAGNFNDPTAGNSNSPGNFINELIYLNPTTYTGDTITVQLIATSDWGPDLFINDFYVEAIPACPWPVALTLNGVTDTNATISFNDPFGTDWDIEWGPVGFTQGTGSVTSFSNDTISFGPLAANTCYDVYLRSNCTAASNGVSIWRGPIQLCTQCSPLTTPYTQNYDGTTAPELDNCWSPLAFGPNASNFLLQTNSFINQSPANSMQLASGGTSAGFIGIASPRFSDLDTTKRVEFQVYKEIGFFGGGADLIVGVMSDISDPSTFELVDTIFEVNLPDNAWSFEVLNLDNHNLTNGGHVVFQHGLNNTFSNLYVDNFNYVEIPSCQAPIISTLTATGISTTGATAVWGANSQGVKTYFAWGSVGFVPGVAAQLGIDSVAGTVDQGSITGLSPQTTYEFYVQDSCVGAGLSPWVGPFTFTTPCLPASMPYYESFDTWSLTCWDSAGGSAFWTPYNASAGDQYARADFWANSTGIYVLTSRPIDIALDAQLRFDWSHLYSGSYPDDQLLVLVKTLSATSWDTVLNLQGPTNFNDPTAGNFNTPGQFITEEVILDPFAYTGDTIQVQVIAKSDFGPDLFVNDLYVEQAPTCPKLINVAATNVSFNTTTLNWNASPNASNYEVWYGPQGFFQGTLTAGGTRQFVTPDSLNVSALIPNTCYEYLVRAVCAPGDSSNWVGPVIFCTPCAPSIAPYYESFDGVNPGVSGDFGNCWTGNPETGTGFPQNYSWQSVTGATPTFGTGPTGDATSGNGNYLFTTSNNGNANDVAQLLSPLVDISALTSPEVRFSYHMFGTNIDTLFMDVNDGTGWSNGIFFLEGNQQSALADPWLDTAVSLAAFSSATTVQVRFRTVKVGFGAGDYSIDEFFVDDPLTCFQPSNIQVTASTQNSLTVDWTTGGATNWQVVYDTAGAAFGNGTWLSATAKPFTITGLNPGTLYQVWVRDSCGLGDVSFFTGPANVFTDCPNLQPLNLPYVQDFENLGGTYQSTVQLCDGVFSSLEYTNTNPLGRVRFEAGAAFVRGGNKAATLDMSASGSNQINLLDITMDMSNYLSSNSILMDFYYMHHGEENNPNDRVWIRGSQTDTWIEVYNLWANQGASGQYNTVTGIDVSGTLATNSQSFSSTFQVRLGQEDNFPATSTTASDGYTFDDITIYDTASVPSCVNPSALAHNTVRCDSVEVTWSSSAATVQTVLEYGSIGFVPGTGTLVANASSPELLSGLTASTDYDVYLVDICATDTSAPVGPYTFNTGTVGAPVAAFNATQQASTLTSQAVDFDANTSTGSGNSYAWDFGDGNSSTAAVFTNNYLTNGTFTVTLIVTNACGSDTVTQVITTAGIGLEENALGRSLNVFPNPTSDVVNVSFETMNSGEVQIRLVDVQGREIRVVNEKVNGNTYQKAISVKALSSGMYILEVQSGDLKARRAISVK
jgi:hypothetical protein